MEFLLITTMKEVTVKDNLIKPITGLQQKH